MKKEIIIDFSSAVDEKSVIECFVKALGLPEVKYPNWDGFSDHFRNLDSDSAIIRSSHPNISELHLILKNLNVLTAQSRDAYSTLCRLLVGATDINNRGDGISFTFNVVNEDLD